MKLKTKPLYGEKQEIFEIPDELENHPFVLFLVELLAGAAMQSNLIIDRKTIAVLEHYGKLEK